MKYKKKIIVTCALIYSNNYLHIGHLLENIQADVWVKYKKMKNNKVYFLSGSDDHGTPIMLKAEKIMIKPKIMVKKISKKNISILKKFNIKYDKYYSTNKKRNKKILISIYKKILKKKLICENNVNQFYDNKKKIFLPDRYIIGTCSKCKFKNQFGDNCNNCGYTYDSTELIEPKSILTNIKPIVKKTKHLFINIQSYKKNILKWVNKNVKQKEVINIIKYWMKKKLKKWNISRDYPYYGFKIPNKNKYFYSWFDALICYISMFKSLCNEKKINFNEYWKKKSKTELYHFIGKDIIYFHYIIWIIILKLINYRNPTNIFVHGYATINKKKISKSKNNSINLEIYLKYLNSDYLRYYLLSKSSNKIKDININLYDLRKKINNEIINKIINLASRTSSFINKNFNNNLYINNTYIKIYNKFILNTKKIEKFYNERKYNKLIKKILFLTNKANRYINDNKPWELSKNNIKVQNICSLGINMFKVIITYLKFIMPNLSKKVENFLNTKISWNKIKYPLNNHKINVYKSIQKKIKIYKIKKIINESKKKCNFY